MTAPRIHLAIRTRLALFFTGLLVAALVVFGGGVYVVLRGALERSFDSSVSDSAGHAADALAQDVGADGRLQPSTRLVGQLASTGGRVVVFDGAGDALADSAAADAPSLGLARSDLRALGADRTVRERTVGTDVVRLAVRPVRAPDGSLAGYVAWASSTLELRNLLGTVSSALVAGGLLVAALALAASWFLARRALTPVAEVTETARAISLSGDFAARVEVGPPDDEVGELAVAFNEMLTALERNHQALQRFLGDASHELRSPLTTILANLDLASRLGLADAERRAILSDARAEAERMGRLVRDLLALARVESGARLEFAPVELDAVVLESVRQARQAVSGVRMHVASVEPAEVYGDRDRLKELFLIVLDNAGRYTPAGGSVMADLKVVDGQVRITVSDTGIGISQEDRQHLFERLYRGERARQLRPSGTGLGLAIAKWIVDAHGGTIGLDGRPEGGTVVTITLPQAATGMVLQ